MDRAVPSKIKHPLFEGLIALEIDGDEEEGGVILEDIRNLTLNRFY